MTTNIQFTLSGSCPIKLGSPTKVATTAWKNWGVTWKTPPDLRKLLALSESAYAREWERSSDVGLRDIALAAEAAGLADCNQILNAAVASKVREALPERRRLTILDVGAGTGETSAAVLAACPWMRDVSWHLVDPSETSLGQAVKRLFKVGLSGGRRLFTHVGKAIKMSVAFKAETFDLIVANASLHHHADLQPVFSVLFRLLKPEGTLVVGDWHNSLWLYPGRVFKLLEAFDWRDRTKDLAAFRARFEVAAPVEASATTRKANEEISRFWQAYAKVRTVSAPRFELLEGHRPPEDYASLLKTVGFADPAWQPLVRNSALLCVHAGKKQ